MSFHQHEQLGENISIFFYAELIQADKIYATNPHRKGGDKENGVRRTASPKEKPIQKSAYQKAKLKTTSQT